ncbi:hypothetical protein [Bacillus infantis]|uniref:Uncharacterized protein n=1 Tax=Bacillus infantis TaxID=324767 RepID=A0A5D4QRM9_9BACI|nr:hypothetical protein [Bacillus infantis]TYS41029.1 hypothetical protein FZD51_24575 [Bacillus infantis]
MEQLKNEKGNTTLFMISFFGIFALIFMMIANFANVLIEKQHASNNAEQASLVASGIILEALDTSITEYDKEVVRRLLEEPDLDLEKLRKKVEDEINALPADYKQYEKKHIAINNVLKQELPGNGLLQEKVLAELNDAESLIPFEVGANISGNNGKVEETTIFLNDKNRIEVETSTRYKAVKFDEYFSENQRYIKQKGQGPSFDFAEAMSWSLNLSPF